MVQTIKSGPSQAAARKNSDEERELSENPTNDLVHYLTEYARENPARAALWCFGAGFVLGWRLKPW